MLKVTILSDQAKPVAWGANDLGRKPGSMRVQELWLFTCDADGKPGPFPEKIDLILDKAKLDERGVVLKPEQSPYPRGDYTLHPSSVYIDQKGRLGITPRLTPLLGKA